MHNNLEELTCPNSGSLVAGYTMEYNSHLATGVFKYCQKMLSDGSSPYVPPNSGWKVKRVIGSAVYNAEVSFDHGYYLLVQSVQELQQKTDSLVKVGIGGPRGSYKISLAEQVASVIGCTVISMENYSDEARIYDGI